MLTEYRNMISPLFMRFFIIMRMICLFSMPLIASIAITTVFYPGYMSFDTLHALRGARIGVTDSMWPPMVSYVWRVVDLISNNPSAMHFTQVYLLLSAISYIIYSFSKKLSAIIAFLVLYLSIPVILGTVAVIWKDVLMAAFFLMSFAAILAMKCVTDKRIILGLFVFVIFTIFLGVCTRHNAITGAIPIIFYASYVLYSRISKTQRSLWFYTAIYGVLISGAVFFIKTQLDIYSLPDFVKMKSSTSSFIESVRVLDIAGASLCAGENLFPNINSDLTLPEIRKLYDPKHINLSQGLLDKISLNDQINNTWFGILVHHPVCFFYHKYQLTKYLIGANDGPQFLITAPSIDNNEFGYKLSDSKTREEFVSYIVQFSQLTFFKPWFLYLITAFTFILCWKIGVLTVDYATLFLSASFYLISLIMFGNAADARLTFYTTTVFSMIIFISVLEVTSYCIKMARILRLSLQER